MRSLLLQRRSQASSSSRATMTPIGQISLAPVNFPAVQKDHLIHIRARTLTGTTGRIRAALYEGTTNRSGDLESLALTNTLSEYLLVIPDVKAATITSYNNLSIKFWGYDSGGNPLTFEVSELYLTLLTPIPVMPFPLGDANDA